MRIRLAAAALTAAAFVALTACSSGGGGGGGGDKGAAAPTGTVAATATATAAATNTDKAVPGLPAKPTGPQRAAYLAALKAVDPAIVSDPEGAVADGRNQCTSLDGGARNPDHSAAERFGDAGHPLTDTQGKAINLALRATLCPKS